ncbi:MAG: hypothetical protein ACLTXT_01475 [Ruminococcus callidus]
MASAAVARGLAEDGYRVAGVYCRSQEEMASLAASCGVIPIAADLAQTEMLPRLAETVLEQLGWWTFCKQCRLFLHQSVPVPAAGTGAAALCGEPDGSGGT